ncbi:MAG: hypothetical protein ACTSRI_12365 [Promethearchaeota archaeon]
MSLELKRLHNATDNLVNQQFYYPGSDIIIGRTPEVSIKIRKSGEIIQKFKNLFNENMDFFLRSDYFKFLLKFKKIKGLTEKKIKKIHKELEAKLKILRDDIDDYDNVILYTLVLNSLISNIRNLHFNNSIDEINKRIKKKRNVLSDDKIHDEMDKLFMRNNDNISILYNISYLDALAESFNYKKVARICKIQKGKYMNRVVDLITSSNN